MAFALAKSLADNGLGGVSFGSGAKDTTRLAASNPEMWIDILLYNEPAVTEALSQTEAHLAELRRLLATARTRPGSGGISARRRPSGRASSDEGGRQRSRPG